VIEQARRELAEAEAADVSQLPTPELAEEMRQLHDIELAARAQRLRRLEVFDRVAGYVDDGQVTTAAWLRTELDLPHSAANTEVSVARVRRSCPQLAAAFDAGRTSFRHQQIAAVAIRRLGQPEVWPVLDERITSWAQEHPVAEFAARLDELVDQLTPDPKPSDEKQADQRRLSVTGGFHGMVNVSGRLTPETGEKLRAALSAASRPDVEGETRSPRQRQHDALDHTLDTVLDTALLPVDGGEKPHINLLVPLDQLDEPAALAAPVRLGELWNEPADHLAQRAAAAAAFAEAVDRRPRFSWTGPTTPGTARRLSCDAILLPIFTRGGQPLDVGGRTRIISAPLRAFVVARDRHCRWPGCNLDPRWCECHHLAHWKDGGPTDRDNLILFCDNHHRAAHSGQFTVVQTGPGTVSTRSRQPGDPYYKTHKPDPPPVDQLSITGMLTSAARRLRTP
jgi:uncharacterized protein DUF222